MKKFLIAFAVAAIAVAGSFAQDALAEAQAAAAEARESVPQSLQGTWYDKKYDCNWVLTLNATGDGLCKLVDASTGSVYYTFTKNNVTNFQQKYDMTNGAVITFECPAKRRTYRFVKPIAGTTDLDIEIYHTYFKETHKATLPFKGSEIN